MVSAVRKRNSLFVAKTCQRTNSSKHVSHNLRSVGVVPSTATSESKQRTSPLKKTCSGSQRPSADGSIAIPTA